MKPKQIAFAALFAAAPVALALAAAPRHENNALAIASAKATLSEAIAAAERHAGGKAVKAELEQSNGHWVFDVEVVKSGQVLDVQVSADDAHVLSAKEDRAENDDGDDADD